MAGRPTTYVAERAAEICDRVAAGETLQAICNSSDAMPARGTVYRWCDANAGFRDMYARAREASGHVWAERALSAALAADPSSAHAARVKFDALRWYASKLAPKDYGERVQAEVSGPSGGPMVFRWAEAPGAAVESTEDKPNVG